MVKNMIEVADYIDVDDPVEILFADGTTMLGIIASVEDEEESGLGERGLSFVSEGRIFGLAESEIESITIRPNAELPTHKLFN